MLSDLFFKELLSDPDEQILIITRIFFEWDSKIPAVKKQMHLQEYIDSYASLEAYLMNVGFDFKPLIFTADSGKIIEMIGSFFIGIQKHVKPKISEKNINNAIAEARHKHQQKFDVGFFYKFSDGDLSRIQELLNELRDLITKSDNFTADHKDRLLKKLELLQAELHKSMTSLDKFWGLVGEAGIILGKFGQDAKPFVDRIKEIAELVWRIQTRAEELPSNYGMPLLKEKND